MQNAHPKPFRLILGLLAVIAIVPFGIAISRAIQHRFALSSGDNIDQTCPTGLRGPVNGTSTALTCVLGGGPTAIAAAPTATPVGAEPPVAGQLCPAWVHAAYTTLGPDGQSYATWHPPLDEQYGCFFDHEHGSDPRAYLGFANSGMPLFGYTAAQHGMDEPHNGFKVFVTNDDLNGRAWMITLHQGSGSPRRASQQFHSLDWHISDRSGTTLVDLHLMADFGYASPNCRPNQAIPGTGSGRPFSQHDPARRIVPTTDCVAETPYEFWTAAIDVGGLFQATPTFDIDNATTVVNLANLEELRFMCEFRSPAENCRSANTQWTGNKRGVVHPGQLVNNTTGSPWVMTDVFGTPIEMSGGGHGMIRQYITTSGWDTSECCGNQVVFRIQSYSPGIYIANPLEEAGSAEFGVELHHWPN